MRVTATQLAEQIDGQVIGDGSVELTGIASADASVAGDLTFAEKQKYFTVADQSGATAILVSGEFASASKTLIRVANVRVAMARALALFFPQDEFSPGVHSSATVAASAQVDSTAHIGPNCVIGDGAKIGARAVLQGGNNIGRDCALGDDVRLFPNVVIYPKCRIGNRVSIHASTVIGSDGYGYVFDAGRHRKVLQIGNVIIHDDVEIGSNTSIDRGALGPTVIGQGTKIDNLVHIAHNVVIGAHCLVMGQVGIAGSTELGNYCVIASQSGLAGHLKLGDQVTVGAKSGVMRDVAAGETVIGSPAGPGAQTKRQWIAIQRLPDMMRSMRELEKKVAELTARIGE
jgi:UDP-3-O-[3-hydroxymyristoyl] glucosamine N-acyltransferase